MTDKLQRSTVNSNSESNVPWTWPSELQSLSQGKISSTKTSDDEVATHQQEMQGKSKEDEVVTLPRPAQEINEVSEVNENQENITVIVNQDVGNSAGSNKRRKKVSKVWEEMINYTKDGKIWAKCIHCEKTFDGSSKKGTTHLNNHLIRCRRKRGGGGDVDKSIKTTSDLTSPIVVKEKSVLELIKNCFNEIGYRTEHWDPPVLNSKKVDILRVYEEEKEKLRGFLSKLSCRFSLRIELFNHSYVLRVHYIDNSWEPKWKTFSFQNAENVCGNNLEETLKELCLILKIDRNTCSILYCMDDLSVGEPVDDFAQDGDVIGEINSWFSQRRSLPFGGFLCTIQGLVNSLTFDWDNWLGDSYSGLRRCIDYVNETPSNNRKFQIAVDNAKSKGKTLMTSEILPWDISVLEDFEIVVGYKEAFCELEHIDPGFMSINLTKEEWDEAIVTYEHSKELLESLRNLSESICATPNMYFPKFCEVYMKLLPPEKREGYHLSEKSSPLALTDILASMREEFIARYWSKYNLIIVIAVVLDPRFKMDIVQLWYNKIYGNYADDYLKKTTDDFMNVYDEYERCVSASGEATSSFPPSYLNATGKPCTSSKPDLSSKSELDRYLTEPKFPGIENFDILAWWRVYTPIFPTLARMARDFLAPNISQSIFFHDLITESIVECKDLDDDIKPALVTLCNK